jgi:DnaJ-class molecular chaperone
MIPYQKQKIGDKKIVICPDCDGFGATKNLTSDEDNIKCQTCNGTGKIEGIVTKQ